MGRSDEIKMAPDEDGVKFQWRKKSFLDRLTSVIGIVLCVYVICYILDLFRYVGIYIGVGAHRGIGLGLFLVLAFLTRPATKNGRQDNKLPWYDILLILFSILPTGYYALFQDDILEHRYSGFATGTESILCALLIVAVLEAGRRSVGKIVLAISLFFILHPLLSEYMPGLLYSKSLSIERIISVFYLSESGIFGVPVGVATTIIITFIIFSQLLLTSGASKFFLEVALASFGMVRGGPAKAAVVGSSLFGMISGSPSANVAAVGTVTIPLMKKTGYPAVFAGAVEAVSSTGGQIMPPVMGTVAFLMADITGAGYGAVCIAAAFPAVLYYLSVFMQVDLHAAKHGLRGLSRNELPSFNLKEAVYYLLPLAVLLFLIMIRRYDPEKAALYSAMVLFVASLFRKKTRVGFSRVLGSFDAAAKGALWAAIPCAIAGIIVSSINATGLGVVFSSQVVNLSGGNLIFLLLLAAIASFIMGMGMDVISIYIILSVLIAPSLVDMGVNLLAAHLFVMYWGVVSFITPPVAVAAFVAAGIAGTDFWKVGWQAVRLGVVAFFVPFMFVLNANLILVGRLQNIIGTAGSAIVGVIILAMGFEGFLIRKMAWYLRPILIIGGVLLIYPKWQPTILGICILLPALLWHIFRVVLPSRTTEGK